MTLPFSKPDRSASVESFYYLGYLRLPIATMRVRHVRRVVMLLLDYTK